MESSAIQTLMGAVGDVFTTVIGFIGEVGSSIVEDPLLTLLVVAVPLCGIGVGLFKRLVSIN